MADTITTKNITSVDEVQSVDNTDKVFVNDNGSFKQISVSNLMKQAPSGVTEETDPTVSEWAKQPTKPSYTADEVGALPVGTKIPTKTSDLTNDSGYLTQIPEEYVTETELGQKGYVIEDDIPEKLPSPGTLTFTGAVNDTYDGSTDKIINIPTGGGEGGTSDYNALSNKPKLNGVEIAGNKTSTDYKIVSSEQGIENNGKFLGVGVDGNVTPVDKPTYTASEVGADPAGTANTKVSQHNTSETAHNDIRILIQGLTTRLNTLADSDDDTLDQLSEIVTYIKNNKSLIDGITTSKVNVSDIVNDVVTNVSNRPLSAAQGVVLKGLIDAIKVPEKLPSPKSLTIKTVNKGGSSNQITYDGSQEKSIEISPATLGLDTEEEPTSSGQLILLKSVGLTSWAQNNSITVNNMSDYDMIGISVISNTDQSPYDVSGIQWFKIPVSGSITHSIMSSTYDREGMVLEVESRLIQIGTNRITAASKGYYYSWMGVGNDETHAVPYEIYGMKF